MLKRFGFSLALLTLMSLALGQPNAPKAELQVTTKSVVAGGKLKVVVKFTIIEGLHAYQNPPSKDYMIPVSVSVKGKDFKVSSVTYPKGVARRFPGETEDTMVYENTIEIPVTLQAPKKPGTYTVKLNVNYQLCTDKDCYPPDDIVLTAKFQVTAPKKP